MKKGAKTFLKRATGAVAGAGFAVLNAHGAETATPNFGINLGDAKKVSVPATGQKVNSCGLPIYNENDKVAIDYNTIEIRIEKMDSRDRHEGDPDLLLSIEFADRIGKWLADETDPRAVWAAELLKQHKMHIKLNANFSDEKFKVRASGYDGDGWSVGGGFSPRDPNYVAVNLKITKGADANKDEAFNRLRQSIIHELVHKEQWVITDKNNTYRTFANPLEVGFFDLVKEYIAPYQAGQNGATGSPETIANYKSGKTPVNWNWWSYGDPQIEFRTIIALGSGVSMNALKSELDSTYFHGLMPECKGADCGHYFPKNSALMKAIALVSNTGPEPAMRGLSTDDAYRIVSAIMDDYVKDGGKRRMAVVSDFVESMKKLDLLRNKRIKGKNTKAEIAQLEARIKRLTSLEK
ncbi:MAG: hypothetical protein FWD15_02945 [Alphaproteobacteria bacterium]|nr:hypothetical protein [Alphaproteobacteria bacterium]